ncbi:sulfatase [Rhizobium sp. FY34]|uniref:sulfatase n=1 Tax=Rhizobium sp. FY34 TaxID=2562309 RepID=UPI001FEE4D10|nr:sulfatase [Rhizobium sp. FY34]
MPTRQWPVPVWFMLFALVTGAILNLPDHPDALSLETFLRLPLEVILLGLLLLVIPRRLSGLPIALILIALGLILCLKLADLGTQAAFQRPFNPYLDGKMLKDGWNLLSGSLGLAKAALACSAILAAFLAILGLISHAMRRMTAGSGRPRMVLLLPVVALAAAGSMAIARPSLVANLPLPPIEFSAARYLSDRLVLIASSVADMRRFEVELAGADPAKDEKPIFEAVKGRDVILIFVESYGRSALEDPLYAPMIGERLDKMAQQLENAGFSMASRWIGSPTIAGLSWLAHGTFLSGLWIDSQSRYDRLMMSGRTSLNRLFSDAGWDSIAVMPAITMDWPEAAWYGYDRILAEKDLGYRGKPFNWMTMPDQYTLSAFQRMVRDRPDRKPVMAEIALISSHAPWTPIPHLIDWDSIGNGTIFNEQAAAGETPTQVWADPDKIRTHYIRTVDYSLETLGDYISRYGQDALFIVLGDHQPAAIVTGTEASRAVPLHVISRDRALMERFRSHGFEGGLVPSSGQAELPMSQMRRVLTEILRPLR